MKSDEPRSLIISASSSWLVANLGLSLASVATRVVHHVSIELAERLERTSFLMGFAYGLANRPSRNSSPVVLIAQQIRARLLASPPATRPPGFPAPNPGNPTARTPLRLRGAWRSTAVEPTTSNL